MSDDIGADLLTKVRREFAAIVSKKSNDDYIRSILQKVDNGTASLEDVSKFTRGVGSRLADIIKSNVTQEALPDGKMYYNIANTVLGNTLHDNYELVNGVAAQVQKNLDETAGIKIKPQKADYPADRVHKIVNSVCDDTVDFGTIQRRMTVPVQNVTESFYGDYVKANANFRHKAGLECHIIRNDHGGCCEWCAKLTGKYSYPDDVPKDVYRRHDNCTCDVTYTSEKGYQNLWSKKSWTPSAEEKERMANTKANITRYTPEQAKVKENEIKKCMFGVDSYAQTK